MNLYITCNLSYYASTMHIHSLMLSYQVFRTPKTTMVYVFQEKIKYEVGFYVQSQVLTQACSFMKSAFVFRLIKKLQSS